MARELAVTLSAPLVGVELVDPDSPLATVQAAAIKPAGAPSENDRKRLEELERQRQEEHEAIERVLARMTETARWLEEQHRRRLSELQRAAVELGVTIASRILHEKVAADDFAVETLAQQAVARLETQQPVTVHLHPADKALLERRLGDGRPLGHDAGEVRVVADASLQRGDCRAESGDVSVLAQLDEQLAEIRRHLLGSMEHARTGP